MSNLFTYVDKEHCNLYSQILKQKQFKKGKEEPLQMNAKQRGAIKNAFLQSKNPGILLGEAEGGIVPSKNWETKDYIWGLNLIAEEQLSDPGKAYHFYGSALNTIFLGPSISQDMEEKFKFLWKAGYDMQTCKSLRKIIRKYLETLMPGVLLVKKDKNMPLPQLYEKLNKVKLQNIEEAIEYMQEVFGVTSNVPA